MTAIPEWYSDFSEITKHPLTWIDEAYFLLGFDTWPGGVHIREAFETGGKLGQPISLHEAIAKAAVNEDRKYRYVNSEAKAPKDAIILRSKKDAELILKSMQDVIKKYGLVSLSDLKDFVGLPTTYLDHKRVWKTLDNVTSVKTDEGYFLNLPTPQSDQGDT